MLLSPCRGFPSGREGCLGSEWVYDNRECLLRLEVDFNMFSFVVRAWTEMEIRCVKCMYRLKLDSSENNSGFKGF